MNEHDPAGAYINTTPSASVAAQEQTLRPLGMLPIDKLPQPFRPLFPYAHFNKMQSTCFQSAYHEQSNLIVAAPTGRNQTHSHNTQ